MSVFYSKRINEKAREVKNEAVAETPVVEPVDKITEDIVEEVVTPTEITVTRNKRNRR